MSKWAPKVLHHYLWPPLVCFGLAYLAMQTEPMEQMAWRTLDWRTKIRAYFQPPADERIAIILFGDETELNLVTWPPDRAYHGMLSELISVTGAAVECWDVILDSSREGDGDHSMSQGVKAAMDRGTQVITGAVSNLDPVENAPAAKGPTQPIRNITGDIASIYGDDYLVEPFPMLREVSWFGVVDAPKGADGIIREIPLVVRIGKVVYPSLALQTVMAYHHVAADEVKVRLGDAIYLSTHDGELRVPIGPDGKYFINYRYDHDDIRPDFPTKSYIEVLLKLNSYYVDGVRDGPAPPNYKGKVVFIGQTVTGRADAGPTPRSAYSPLVLMHANVVNNILARDFAKRVPNWMAWMGMLALAYVCVWLTIKRSITLVASFSLLVIVSHLSLAYWGWIWWSLWFPWIGPLLGLIATQFIVIGRRIWDEQKAKQEIKGMFGSYVSPELVERMVNSGERPRLGGHQVEITAYFSDIQGFSSFSEKLPPDRLVELMNEYLTVCTDIVQEEGGTLDKYIGDAVVVIFGAPLTLEGHAYRACVASQRVQLKLAELRDKWRSEGNKWPEIVWAMQSRIGLNTGNCIVGNMGSRTRFNYTMMGDDVNLAARMESGAKSWGVYTMCTDATKLACLAHGGDRVVFRALGKIVVKGRAQANLIHEVVGLKENITPEALECVRLFEAGLECYYACDWDGACARFKESALLEPNQPDEYKGVSSNPSLVYLKIIEQYREKPPEPGWDGVYVMKEK
ncbi:MAG: adenylate/guanylate cyclase domain-containing protein [Cephaloticoccus sp.]|nr:adenylate/guanylate cyclase domain-containing protein [Cephaloticoccus sp.]MCF7760426.1 adenylate/guanylate cyclase domain-containing protein [Cephaloticoccus sp.]